MQYKKFLPLGLIFLVSLIPILDLFHSGLPITHDGQDHVARIANFYQNLKEGNIIPRWAGNLNWGYGHPILEFLYPLPSYITSFFHFLGFSLDNSIKIVLGIGMLLSGLFMYLWLKEFLDEKAGLVGSILYMFAPYRFVEVYVRGDLGENLAFTFVPLVFYFILKLSKEKKARYVILGSLSLSFLILAHNAISLMFLPPILTYGFYLGYTKGFKKYFILYTLYFILLGFGLSAFFWIPGLLEAKYTLRNIVTQGGYLKNFVDVKSLFYGAWSYGGAGQFTVQLGIIHWVTVLFSPFAFFILKKNRDKKYLLVFILLINTFFAIFLMLRESNFIWERIMLLQNFQFPWRFLAITVFTLSALGGVVISMIPRRFKFFITCFLLLAILFFNKDYWHAKGYFQKPESFYTSVYNGTTDTGESAPIWSVRFMEKRPKAHIEIIDGKAEIKEIKRSFTNHIYAIDAEQKSRIRENTLYFPGWNVYVDGKKTDIEFQDQKNRGLITFFLEKGYHKVNIKFTETKLRLFADMISLITIVGIFAYVF